MLLNALMCVVIGTCESSGAASQTAPVVLAQAIANFNTKAKDDPIGKDQTPLAESEVVAAIRLADAGQFPEAPPAVFQAFKKIADSHQLPTDAAIEVLTGIDPGGAYIFDVWYVRIRLPKPDGGSYAFAIRTQAVGSRSVAVVARELEKKLKEMQEVPGMYRLEERLKDLQARAAAVTGESSQPADAQESSERNE